jgi:hypothetical protein
MMLVLLTLLIKPAIAQELIFSAQAAAQQVGLQDPFEVQYRIENAREVSSFQLPPLQQVQVLDGPSRNIQYREINGQRTVTVILTYVMKARSKGTLQLDGATAIADGHTIHSNALRIRVVEGSMLKQKAPKPSRGTYDPFEEWLADDLFGGDPFEMMRKQQQQLLQQWQGTRAAPKAAISPALKREDINKNIFFLVETDKRNVYRGEQINVSYKLYTRLPMEINITKTPDLQGFWSQDFKLPNPPQPVKEIYKGQEYQVFEIKRTAIFPTQTGTLKLDQAKAEGVVRLVHGGNAGNLFDSFFGSLLDEEALQAFGQQIEEIPIQLQSSPIDIHVNELPTANKPSSFQGAVGQFSLETNISKTEINENEAATLTLTIRGSGNLKLAEPPRVLFPASLNAFEPSVYDSLLHTEQFIAGFKEINYTFTPNKTGTYTIPPVQFSYFDPVLKTYKTLSSPAYPLQVTAGNGTRNNNRQDIHDITTGTGNLQREQTRLWLNTPWYWAVYSLPLLALLVVFAFRPKPSPEKTITTPLVNDSPNNIAMTRLALAEEHLRSANHAGFYQETAKAIWLYLSNKLNIPLSKLSHDEAERKFNELNIPSNIKDDFFRITQTCEAALYSPVNGSSHMHQIYSDSIRLIGQLEHSI